MHQKLTKQELDNLEQKSMLYQAKQYVTKYKDKFWFGKNSYSSPQTKILAENNSVWLDLYPPATLTNHKTVLQVYSNADLLSILSDIGINVIHTNPMQAAGSINPDLKRKNNSIDGGYDRIAYEIDPEYGDNQQYKTFVENAKNNNILIAGDIIPGHTGVGYDFYLACLNYKQYPNLYVMTELKQEDWELIPESFNITLSSNFDNNLIPAVNLTDSQVEQLITKDYLPGIMTLVFFKEPGIKDTNWSVTNKITGTDGITRRWLYLHWFKQGQPSLNWMDPSFAAQQLLAGDIVQHRFELGTKILRLDQNAMLGLEKIKNSSEIWSVGHPLSFLSTRQLAMIMRKLGGFTYEENNSDLDALNVADDMGPDLSYDFAMRTGYIHAIATGDASLLKLQQQLAITHGVKHNRLIHAMQNHDNLCYELFHFDQYPNEVYSYKNQNLTGKEINNIILNEAKEFCLKNNLVFHLGYGGIQAHFVELIAARLNIDYKNLIFKSKPDNQKAHNQIEQLMLLAVFYNAMQPGIFQLSAWDLLGIVHQNEELLSDKMVDGDTRWLCRSGFDLLDELADMAITNSGIPKGYSIFGSLQQQYQNKNSFINKVKDILIIRHEIKIAISQFVDIIKTNHDSVLINIFEYSDIYNNNKKYIVVNNFGDSSINIFEDLNTFLIKYLGAKYSDCSQSELTEHISNTRVPYSSSSFTIPAFSGRVYEL